MAKELLWGKPRQNKKKNGKDSGYEGGAEKLLQFGDIHTGPRELERLKIDAELRKWGKAGRPPTVTEIQQRYIYTEEFALKFLRKLEKARNIEQKKKQQKAPVQTKPVKGAVPPVAVVGMTGAGLRDVVTEPTAEVQLKAVLEDIRRRYGDEMRQKGEQTSAREGFVYLVIHPCFGGWVKGGMTIDYEQRLSTYNTSDPLSRFEYAELAWVPDRRNAERVLLAALQEITDETRGEWFRSDVQDALRVFRELKLGCSNQS